MTIKSANYNSPACESGIGNVSADEVSHIFSGAEAADTTVLLRRMSERNTYMRMTVIAEAGFVALTEIDLGYVSRETGQADNLVAFKDGLDIQANTYTQVLVDLKEIAFKHDLAMTIKVNAAGNAGKKVKVLVEFINKSG